MFIIIIKNRNIYLKNTKCDNSAENSVFALSIISITKIM